MINPLHCPAKLQSAAEQLCPVFPEFILNLIKAGQEYNIERINNKDYIICRQACGIIADI